MRLTLETQTLRLAEPFRISGYLFESMPSVVGSKEVRPSSSITLVGGARPVPSVLISVASGSATEAVTTVIAVGLPSCVTDSWLLAPLNSPTVPLSVIWLPTATVGADEVKTNTASDVAMSPSPVGSWR